MPSLSRRLRHLDLTRLARDVRGLAAVEFALVLPIMIAMYFGMAELEVGYSQHRKISQVSRTVADLTGRMPKVSEDDIRRIFAAATSVMIPYEPKDMRIKLSSIYVKKEGTDFKARVCWSRSHVLNNFNSITVGDPKDKEITPVPEGFKTEGSYIFAEVEMPYTPTVGHTITGKIDLKEATPWPVRNVAQVGFVSGGTTLTCS